MAEISKEYHHMLEGKVFTMLTAIKRAEPKIMPSGKKQQRWHCACECGEKVVVAHSSLQSGLTKSCGCLKLEAANKNIEKAHAHVKQHGSPTRKDLTGLRKGRLVARKLLKSDKRNTWWLCDCDCGNTHEVKAGLFTFGHVQSCGCLKSDSMAEIGKTNKGKISVGRRKETREKYVGKRFGMVLVKDIEYTPKGIAVCVCDCGNTFRCVPGDLGTGQQQSCGCMVGNSHAENELVAFLAKHIDIEADIPLDSSRQRFDAVCHSQKIAIEFNGVYWHSLAHKDKYYHQDKRQRAEAAGYQLISIWQDDWEFRKDQITTLLLRRLGVTKAANVGGRALTIEEISHLTANKFHNTHHLQSGTVGATKHYGLFKDGALIGAASFQERKKQTILSRYTVAAGVSIAGGLQKLIKRHGSTKPLVTYADRDYFTGSLYESAGFVKDSTSLQLTYFANGNRQRRERYMKKRLAALGMPPAAGETEQETLKRHKIFACYNSGIDRWVFNQP